MASRERASCVFGSHLHFKKPINVNPVFIKSTNFGILAEDIEKFDGIVENIQKHGGIPGILKALKVDPSKGIDASEEDLQCRVDTFGSNTYPIKDQKPFWMYLWEALQDETLLILIVCAVVSLVVGLTTEDPENGWYDGGGIAFAIVLVVLVSSISNYKQALQFQELNAEKRKILVNVTRRGRREKVVIFDLVVGDVVHLSIGDQVPADALLLKGHSMVVDESSMTGESDPVPKDETKPFFLSGCKVLDGFGEILVIAVGMKTEWGKVMATLSEENDDETPLQVRLNHLATTIGKIGMTVAVLVFLVLIIRFLASDIDFKHFTPANGRSIVDFFAVAVTIVVVAVPEGLPLAVTLTLAFSMHKMMDDRALVRHLSACETMGSSTTICSDKTGTLTLNMMTVVNSWVCGKLRNPEVSELDLSKEIVKLLFDGIVLNTNGNITYIEENDPEISGSPTEVAVLNWGTKLQINFDKVKQESTVLYVDAFNSSKKRMGVVVKNNIGHVWVHWKGAAEVLLGKCSHFLDANGNCTRLTKEKIKELESVINAFAAASLRTLCFACKEIFESEIDMDTSESKSIQIPDSDLTCIAIIGIKDPCRPGVPEAVHKCQLAGIKVRMVTGDNIMTAKAIATECGILTKNGIAIEGRDFRVMSIEEQYKIIPSIDVMARSSPTDKHTLVKRLLEMGEVVAVTGDGTNDAPALHEASIGLAMGIVGTEVAKESSDIIILDDNFASIVKVVRWGRSVFSNIQKFIQFQCTVNGVALILNFVAAIITGSAPLTAVQLLWVNLIMDTMGALALATEPPNDGLLNRKPIGRRDPLITNIMWRNMVGQMAYQLALLLLLQFRGIELLGLHDKTKVSNSTTLDYNHEVLGTMIFNSFVFCQVFNEINSRKPDDFNVFEGLWLNKLFLYVIILTVIVQVLIVEFCGTFATTVPLSWGKWLICVGFGAVSLPLAVIIKAMPVPETPLFEWLSQPKSLVFRNGASIKRTALRSVSRSGSLTSSCQNGGLGKSRAKFYEGLAVGESKVSAEESPEAQDSGRWTLNALCSRKPPSVKSDSENPQPRNSQVAWD